MYFGSGFSAAVASAPENPPRRRLTSWLPWRDARMLLSVDSISPPRSDDIDSSTSVELSAKKRYRQRRLTRLLRREELHLRVSTRRGSVWLTTLVLISLFLKLEWFHTRIGMGTLLLPAAIATFASVMVVVGWVSPLRPVGRAWALMFVDLLVSTLIVANLVNYRAFQDVLSVAAIQQANQVDDVGSSVTSLMRRGDFLAYVDIPLLLVWAVHITRDMRRAKQQAAPVLRAPRWVRWACLLAMLSIGVGMSYVTIEAEKKARFQAFYDIGWWNMPIYYSSGLLNFYAYDINKFVRDRLIDTTASEDQIAQVQAWFDAKWESERAAGPSPMFGSYAGSNVLVIQVEALQQFPIGLTLNGAPVTPNLNELISTSAYFPNFVQQTWQGRTSDAELEDGCSLQPLPQGSAFVQYPSHAYDCTPRLLTDRGYYAAVYHSSPKTFYKRNQMYASMGYDDFYSESDFTQDETVGMGLGDRSLFRQTSEMLAAVDKPFYATSISMSSHLPYETDDLTDPFDVGDFQGTKIGDYLQTLHYFDTALGEYVAQLKANGLWDSTLVMMYGDHDNSIYDPAIYEKLLGRSMDGRDMTQLIQSVPFLVHFPQDANSGTYDKQVGQIDLAPTILDLLGIKARGRYMMGSSMFAPGRGDVVFRNGGFIKGDVQYEPSSDGSFEHGQCYSASTHADLDPAKCLALSANAVNELSVSDLVIQYDLVHQLSRGD